MWWPQAEGLVIGAVCSQCLDSVVVRNSTCVSVMQCSVVGDVSCDHDDGWICGGSKGCLRGEVVVEAAGERLFCGM